MYLEQINGPQDVKKLSVEQLNTLADEMRAALLNRLSKHGGHFGPNFGMVGGNDRTPLRFRITKR